MFGGYTAFIVWCSFIHIYGAYAFSVDEEALIAIKASIHEDPLGLLSDWKKGTDPCTWKGVRCDSDSRVISLTITSRSVSEGSGVFFPSEDARNHGSTSEATVNHGSTSEDTVNHGSTSEDTANHGSTSEATTNHHIYRTPGMLDLNSSPYTRHLRLDMRRCELRALQSSSEASTMAKLSGTISPVIGNLSQLRILSLPCNSFFGEIPDEISALMNLEWIDLAENEMSGSIPRGIGRLSGLKHINLAYNAFEGKLPTTISCLQKLKVLNVAGNRLSGEVGVSLGKLPELEVLDISSNLFVGTIPLDITDDCHKLVHVHMENNFLTGRIPSGFGRCPCLKTLKVSSNLLTGPIPTEIGELTKLEVLDVSQNGLNGSIPSTLVKCSQLVFLILTNTANGPCIHDGVSKDVMGWNPKVAGYPRKEEFNSFLAFPMALLNLPRLQLLWAPRAAASSSGILPTYWGSCKNLQVLNLAENSLTGTLSEGLTQCRRLVYLDLGGNKLEGYLPSKLSFNCMAMFNISGNSLNRESLRKVSRDGLWNCPMLLSEHSISNMRMKINAYFSSLYCGSVKPRFPYWLSNHGMPVVIRDVNDNDSTGSLIGDIIMEKKLSYGSIVSRSKFEVLLSKCLFAACLKFEALLSRLSLNQFLSCEALMDFKSNADLEFIGSIPKSLENGKNLAHPDFSMRMNDLNEYKFRRRRLFGISSNSSLAPHAAEPSLEKRTHSLNAIIIAAITSGCVIGFAFLIFLVLFAYLKGWIPIRRRRRRRHIALPERCQLVTFQDTFGFELTYENIVEATGQFSLNNLIGSGGFGCTYKAEVRPGLYVAVKKIYLGKFEGTQQFEAEVHSLGKVRHANLVTLIGYYASKNEMFLLYNYLPGGNLQSLIHDGERGFVSWRVRYKIALDIAEALIYLHDERILHRDIKPSNVLLDKNLNAFLSDFGLARLLNASETHVTTDVFGTLGYVAPEYVLQRRVSDKADVYSYGVLLLVLISGKKALDGSFSEHGPSVDIVAWAGQLYESGKSKKVFAHGLWEQGPQSELINVLKLALKCTVDSRSVRPSMREVGDALRII